MRLCITSQSFLCGSFQPPAELVAIVFNHSTAKKVNKLGLEIRRQKKKSKTKGNAF